MRKKITKRILSLSTGFAVNRFNNLNIFSNFIKNFLKLDYIQLTSDFMMLNMNDYYILKHNEKLDKILRNKKIMIPNSETIFKENDDVVFFSETKSIKKLEELLSLK